jgi:hypothetical protein
MKTPDLLFRWNEPVPLSWEAYAKKWHREHNRWRAFVAHVASFKN